MGIEQALLGEWLLTYVFFVYGMMCYALKHSKAKLPGFPVKTQDEDHVLMCYWMHEQGIIKKKGLRFLGIKQQTIYEFYDAELNEGIVENIYCVCNLIFCRFILDDEDDRRNNKRNCRIYFIGVWFGWVRNFY